MESSHSVIKWFKNLKNKQNCHFITFDVVNFYPSITSELLIEALYWAGGVVKITEREKNIILEAKQSLLYKAGEPWKKK